MMDTVTLFSLVTPDTQRWALGLFVALVIGAPATWVVSRLLRLSIGTRQSPLQQAGLPFVSPWITGTIERLFFATLIAFDLSGTATAMVGWITVKMVTNWNRASRSEEQHIASALVSLLSSMISMLFAVLGGVICRGE